jgi:hypothetical protein
VGSVTPGRPRGSEGRSSAGGGRRGPPGSSRIALPLVATAIRHPRWHVYACLVLMLLTAIGGALSDTAFSPAGYAWQMLNCALTGGWVGGGGGRR